MDIDIKLLADNVSKQLSDFAYKQIDFALARAVTDLAKLAQAAEKQAMPEIFDKPTKFTINSIAVESAKKHLPIARVYVMDIAAKYLQPFEDNSGQVHYMVDGKKYLAVPIAKKNIYGNMPRNYLAQIRGRKDVFFGIVGKTRGAWQRMPDHKLKLLVEFIENMPVRQGFGFGDRADAIVRKNFKQVMGRRLAEAIASSK